MNKSKIRVLHLASNPRYAGLERHVASLVKALLRVDGVEPSLVTFHDGQLVEEARSLGIPVEVISLGWVFDATAITRVAKILSKWNVDCLHSHGYKANVIGALAARWNGLGAIVCTEHGRMEPFNGFARMKMEAYEILNTWVSNRFADRVITVSEDLCRHLKPRYPLSNLVTVHNGIRPLAPRDPQVLQTKRASLGLDRSAPLIGIVGRLVPVKRHSDFLRAAAIISAKRPDAHFLVIGDGPLLEPLQKKAESLGLANIVHFLGFRSDVIDLMATLDLLVFSSLHEGVPYTLLEAMSLGVPVIATAVGGLPEIIEDNVTGLLVPPQEPETLAQACLGLLSDPERSRHLGEASRHRCRTRFSDIRMAEAIRQIYYEVVSNKDIPRDISKFASSHGKAKIGAMEP